MTQTAKAYATAERRSKNGSRWIIVSRPEHPVTGLPYIYAVRESDKHRWARGETVLCVYENGTRVAA